MQALFSPNSKLMRIMSRVGDLLVLNVIFLITCVPIITIGAASSALYTVCFRFGTRREDGLLRTYFRAFKEDFGRATLLWFAAALCIAAAGANTYMFYLWPGALSWLSALFAVLLVLILLIAGYLFPLVSQFGSGALSTFKNALILSLGYLPRSVLIMAFNVFPFALMITDFYGFFQWGFLWAALYFSTAAYVNSILLRKVFKPYLDDELDQEPEEEKP